MLSYGTPNPERPTSPLIRATVPSAAHAWLANLGDVFDDDQRRAVRAAFALAGFYGDLRTLPLVAGEEVCFILDQDDLLALSDEHYLEQVLSQILGRQSWVLASVEDKTEPFDTPR